MSKKIAIVFGGSRGIGAACVQMLREDGFDVAFTYAKPRPEGFEPADGITAHQVDICNRSEVARFFEELIAMHGAQPNCVVANAGINVPPGPLASYEDEHFRRVVEVNLIGAFNVLAEAARHVANKGSIIALTTSMVRSAPANAGPYTATKAAVESLVKSLSKELAGRSVRVNAVAPGPIDTDLFRSGKDAATVERSAALSPLGRVGTPAEVASLVAFLASSRASWILGQIIQPNGGMV